MTDPYSLLLSGAIATLVVAAVAALASRLFAGVRGASASALVCAALALALDAASVAVHWRSGHGPEAEAPMGVAEFNAEHPAFSVVAVLALLVLAATRRPRR